MEKTTSANPYREAGEKASTGVFIVVDIRSRTAVRTRNPRHVIVRMLQNEIMVSGEAETCEEILTSVGAIEGFVSSFLPEDEEVSEEEVSLLTGYHRLLAEDTNETVYTVYEDLDDNDGYKVCAGSAPPAKHHHIQRYNLRDVPLETIIVAETP